MSNIIKPLVIIITIIIGINFMLYRVDYSFQKNRAHDYSFALRTATQDATYILRNLEDINQSYEGNKVEFQDLSIDFRKAEDRFYKTLYKNLGVAKKSDLRMFSNMNIPLVGVVGYTNVFGKLSDGTYTFPMGYTYYDKAQKRTLNFTLGDNVIIKHDNAPVEEIKDLSAIGELSNQMTNKEFRNYIIIETINKFLAMFSTDQYNLVSRNLYKGLEFDLAHADYTSNKKSYSKKSAVIDGVGFFAVIDTFTGTYSNKKRYMRIFSFGGSELLLKE